MAIDGGKSAYDSVSIDAHRDDSQDRSLIRSMVKPSALNDEESIPGPHDNYHRYYDEARKSGLSHGDSRRLAEHKTFEQAAYGAGVGLGKPAEDGPIIPFDPEKKKEPEDKPPVKPGPITPITTRRTKGPKDMGRVKNISHGERGVTVNFEHGGQMLTIPKIGSKWEKGDIVRGTKEVLGSHPDDQPKPPDPIPPPPPKPKLSLVPKPPKEE